MAAGVLVYELVLRVLERISANLPLVKTSTPTENVTIAISQAPTGPI